MPSSIRACQVNEVERGLLDTSTLIDLPLISTDVLPTELAISAITLAELAAGPHTTGEPAERAARRQRLQWAEGTFDPLPFRHRGRPCVRARVRRHGGRWAGIAPTGT